MGVLWLGMYGGCSGLNMNMRLWEIILLGQIDIQMSKIVLDDYLDPMGSVCILKDFG